MLSDKLSFYTKTIPIIEANGKKIDEIILNEKIKPVPRRRCGISETGLYYKGAGIIYTSHYVNELQDTIQLIEKTSNLYEKYHVVNPALFRRYGIFMFQHQPCFSDFEGGCGNKEKKLIQMQEKFYYSAIEEITDVIPTAIPDHNIYIYKIKDVKGSYKDTLKLIEYILIEHYNTAWDKNVWDDISCFGYIRDLADWFISDRFSHKLGTIYSILNAIIKKDKYTYEAIVRELTGLEQLGDHHIIFIAALIVNHFSPVPFDLSMPTVDLYTNLWDTLLSGKACCHLENEEKWSYVKEEYKKTISGRVGAAMKDLKYHQLMAIRK